MTTSPTSLLNFLAASPLLWLLATLLVYQQALAIYARAGFNPLLHPVVVSVAILVAVLKFTGTPYQTYFNGVRFIHFLLGPATVTLAVPLYRQVKAIRRNWLALLFAAAAGSAASVAIAMGTGALLGASRPTVLSLAAKSVTMPIAMSVTEKIGGSPSLTSALVMLTGIFGTCVAQIVLRGMKIPDADAGGFALGVAAHGIGTSRALQISQEMGAFAGLAMGLAGMLTAFVLPFLIQAR
ncbi:LrgB family protein [Noviherbaspirillum autotrophicum]|uniref:Membrane protein n=1 Tax=Noviherbaspirillum autotrophicum TaxID=709839 RepID=A0A0C2BVR2_9BURK|nr:LrgB family protein [Noviherbaspirillum autotrophicum]KIF81639.1 membrane protein [Noviherbaspirillum autotrophicum]KIF82000.1 membrane protein [Noviherbaspirillum autotrophicum]KIF84114.1 membrane protein [Noviherbaspirillum autotrophicum]